MVPAPIQLLAEVVDDTFRSAVCLRWNGDIHTGDLSDLHDGEPDPFYTCKNVRQDASDYDHKAVFSFVRLLFLFEGVLGRGTLTDGNMNFWQKIDKPIIGLSPMDGVTDASFRFITAKHGGPDVTFTEFVNVEAAFHAPHTLMRDLMYSEIERPVVAQIYGHTPEMFYKVAHIVCALGFDGLDINMGCPAKKVAAKGSGAALIRTPELARAIIQSVRQGIQDWRDGQTLGELGIEPEVAAKIDFANRLSGREVLGKRCLIPVSVKTRIGYDCIVVEEWMQTLLAENLAAVTLHGRTLKQGYKGDADWNAIGRAVEIASNSATLILGNGDLRDTVAVCRRVRETGVDGVLLGRAAQGNPWIFRAKEQVKQALRSGAGVTIDSPSVGLEERFRVLLEHSRHFERHSMIQSFVGMRKHLAWYCYDSPGAAELRAQMVRVSHIEELVQCLRAYAERLGLRIRPADSALLEHDARITNAASWFS
jgi:nifR3 family TIM-barrel protein